MEGRSSERSQEITCGGPLLFLSPLKVGTEWRFVAVDGYSEHRDLVKKGEVALAAGNISLNQRDADVSLLRYLKRTNKRNA